VLVRSHAQGALMRRALAALGVGSVEHSQASVFDSPDALELEQLLGGVLEPARDLLGRAGWRIVHAPGWPDEEKQEAAAALAARGVGAIAFEEDPGKRAGLAVHANGNVVDGTLLMGNHDKQRRLDEERRQKTKVEAGPAAPAVGSPRGYKPPVTSFALGRVSLSMAGVQPDRFDDPLAALSAEASGQSTAPAALDADQRFYYLVRGLVCLVATIPPVPRKRPVRRTASLSRPPPLRDRSRTIPSTCCRLASARRFFTSS
jgi:hypothetical protein